MESNTHGELLCSAVHTFGSRLYAGTETCIVNTGSETVLYLQFHGCGHLISESACTTDLLLTRPHAHSA